MAEFTSGAANMQTCTALQKATWQWLLTVYADGVTQQFNAWIYAPHSDTMFQNICTTAWCTVPPKQNKTTLHTTQSVEWINPRPQNKSCPTESTCALLLYTAAQSHLWSTGGRLRQAPLGACAVGMALVRVLKRSGVLWGAELTAGRSLLGLPRTCTRFLKILVICVSFTLNSLRKSLLSPLPAGHQQGDWLCSRPFCRAVVLVF